MSLPQPWVDRLFEKLTLTYGRAFLDRWRDLDIEAVKADWAHELANMRAHPEMIAYALQHLPPGEPPTVLQFRDIARQMPPPKFEALPAPTADREKVRLLLERAKRSLTKGVA
ncbi:MAG: hypothetical protein KGL39_42090 [Patescibacteria group bacterium]|nr:hypothetical protein [Patescibacteria group bacterium]